VTPETATALERDRVLTDDLASIGRRQLA